MTTPYVEQEQTSHHAPQTHETNGQHQVRPVAEDLDGTDSKLSEPVASTARSRDKRPSKDSTKQIIIAVFENILAPSGGATPAVHRLAQEYSKKTASSGCEPAYSQDIIVISPLHAISKPELRKRLQLLGECVVRFEDRPVPVRFFELQNDGVTWWLFQAPGFFEADGGSGHPDPYVYSYEGQADRDGPESRLLRDSLFACAAVPKILIAQGRNSQLIIHAQDWSFASLAKTIKQESAIGNMTHTAVLLTLHNPIDHCLPDHKLRLLTPDTGPEHWPAIGASRRDTVLTRMIPRLDGPVSTVSAAHAQEMFSHPQQTGIFTGHLVDVLQKKGVVGIGNGSFLNRSAAFSAKAIDLARQGDPRLILEQKSKLRAEMLSTLQNYCHRLQRTPDPRRPTFGELNGNDGPLTALAEDIPVFMMIGRFDPGQKGYDVLLRCVQSFPRGAAKFILTPMSPLAEDDTVRPFMQDLQAVAKEHAGDLVVFAHRMDAGFLETMAGATFSVWPSLFEPFGGVNEFYSLGTPAIAHAVGGLSEQVEDVYADPERATGILYHERWPSRFDRTELESQFRAIHNRPPHERLEVPVYQQHLMALNFALATATTIFQRDGAGYGRMLANLDAKYRELDWNHTVNDYLAWYNSACN